MNTLRSGGKPPDIEELLRKGQERVRSMLPEAERQGLGGFTNADADTLERRLRDEVLASRGMLVAWPVVAAFCRTETAPATAP